MGVVVGGWVVAWVGQTLRHARRLVRPPCRRVHVCCPPPPPPTTLTCRRRTLVDRTDVLTRLVSGNCSGVAADGDAAAVERLCKAAARGAAGADFVWGQLLGLHDAYQARWVGGVREARARGCQEGGGEGEGVQAPTGCAQHRIAAPPCSSHPRVDALEAAGPVPAEEADAAAAAAADGAAAQRGDAGAEQQEVEAAQVGEGMEAQEAGVAAATASATWQERRDAALRSLDAGLERLHASLQPGTLLVVVCGQGDTAFCRWAQEQKWRRQQGQGELPPWTPRAEACLAAAGTAAMRGLCFATVKAGAAAGAATAAAAAAPPG